MAQPNTNKKLRDLPAGTVVSQLSVIDGWKEIQTKGGVIGWMKNEYLEEYIENYPVNLVPIADIQTPIETDPEQYVIVDGVKQVNMCGELCCAYLIGISLSELLTKWEVKSPPFYKRIFGSGRARGTGAAELVEMLGLFGVSSKQFVDKKYSPHMLKELSGKVIASVNIDGVTGRLRGAGILHWVVVTAVQEERTGYGFVELYNPFCNRIEVYSWNEFINSAHYPYGAVLV